MMKANINPTKQSVSKARDYLEHARVFNDIARKTLGPNRKSVPFLQLKISIGFSLQAAELAGKGILIALGHPEKDVINKHKKHKLLELMKHVKEELSRNKDLKIKGFEDFLLHTPEITGVQFGSTIAEYFDLHFSRGEVAWPRNYFYPFADSFPGPNPFRALYVMVNHIISVAKEIINIVGYSMK